MTLLKSFGNCFKRDKLIIPYYQTYLVVKKIWIKTHIITGIRIPSITKFPEIPTQLPSERQIAKLRKDSWDNSFWGKHERQENNYKFILAEVLFLIGIILGFFMIPNPVETVVGITIVLFLMKKYLT